MLSIKNIWTHLKMMRKGLLKLFMRSNRFSLEERITGFSECREVKVNKIGIPMKLLVCVISPKKVEQVKMVLWEAGVRGVTISEGSGYGYQKVQVESVQGTDYKVQYQPRVRLEIALPDDELDKVIELLLDTVRTGRVGDGKFFILPLEEVIRVRTGERGENAL